MTAHQGPTLADTTGPRRCYVVEIANVDSSSIVGVGESYDDALILFEEARLQCIATCQEMAEFDRSGGGLGDPREWEDEAEFLRTMKPGDIPPRCMDHPCIKEVPYRTKQ